MIVRSYPRDVFVERVWQYRPGEHVSFVGKTQSGKTTLAFQLLDVTASPAMPAIVLVMKPKDATPATWGRRLGIKRVRTWPPPSAHPWAPSPPRGWLLWPKLGRIDADAGELYAQFHAALADSYAQTAKRRGKPRIVFADEVVGLAAELGLADELDAVWMRGASMGLGLWAATQRPFHAPLHMYSQAEHLFLHRDPDKRNRDRLRDIGGVDPKLIESVMSQMVQHQFLYIRRRDSTMCLVDP